MGQRAAWPPAFSEETSRKSYGFSLRTRSPFKRSAFFSFRKNISIFSFVARAGSFPSLLSFYLLLSKGRK